jgi:hypothetical protein
VKYFTVVLRVIGWEALLRKDVPIMKDLHALKTYEAVTKGSEAVHTAAALSVVAVAMWIVWSTSFAHTTWLLLVNIVVNVYPVMLQRYNRPRVARVIHRFEQRSAAS